MTQKKKNALIVNPCAKQALKTVYVVLYVHHATQARKLHRGTDEPMVDDGSKKRSHKYVLVRNRGAGRKGGLCIPFANVRTVSKDSFFEIATQALVGVNLQTALPYGLLGLQCAVKTANLQFLRRNQHVLFVNMSANTKWRVSQTNLATDAFGWKRMAYNAMMPWQKRGLVEGASAAILRMQQTSIRFSVPSGTRRAVLDREIDMLNNTIRPRAARAPRPTARRGPHVNINALPGDTKGAVPFNIGDTEGAVPFDVDEANFTVAQLNQLGKFISDDLKGSLEVALEAQPAEEPTAETDPFIDAQPDAQIDAQPAAQSDAELLAFLGDLDP